MKKIEKKLLVDSDFVGRLARYAHRDNVERIVEAHMDTLGVHTVPDADYSEEFLEICVAIIIATSKGAHTHE